MRSHMNVSIRFRIIQHFYFLILPFLYITTVTAGIILEKEYRESIVTKGQVFTFATKVKGELDLSVEQRGSAAHGPFRPIDTRWCIARYTLKTSTSRPCLIDHRYEENLPIKSSAQYSCLVSYDQITKREVLTKEIQTNCGAANSEINGAYESLYGNQELLSEVETNSLGVFYRFLNENQQQYSELGFSKNKISDSSNNYYQCGLISVTMRTYCKLTSNCSVNVFDIEGGCLKVFNTSGLDFVISIIKDLSGTSSSPFMYSAAINFNGSTSYSGTIILPPSGSVGGRDSRGERLARMAADYERRVREFTIAEVNARREIFNSNNKKMEPIRVDFKQKQENYRNIDEELKSRVGNDSFKFQTINSDSNFNQLYYAEERRIDAEKIVLLKSSNTQDKQNRQALLDVVKFQHRMADTQFSHGDKDLGIELIKANLSIIDLVLDFSPAGPLKNGLSFLTGFNLAGEKLNSFERAVCLGGIFLPGFAKLGGIGLV